MKQRHPPLLSLKAGRNLTHSQIVEFRNTPEEGIHLRGDDFKGTRYTGRSIQDSIIGSCVYRGCKLDKWTFRETCFSRVGFLDTLLEKLKLYKISGRGVFIVKCEVKDALLEDIFFIEASLMGTIFHNCHFTKVEFSRCDLRGTLFSNCTFAEGVELHDCDLTGTQFYKGAYYTQKGPSIKSTGESSGDCVFYTETGRIPEGVCLEGDHTIVPVTEFENCSALAASWINNLDTPDVYKICGTNTTLPTKNTREITTSPLYREPLIHRQLPSPRPSNRAVLYGTFAVENEQ